MQLPCEQVASSEAECEAEGIVVASELAHTFAEILSLSVLRTIAED
eukprot:CAMPEP_0203858798 /NCGR_PEP_ID=MMETSP0359-20131031/11482_1 /ASSEMBLY_ACC=CAM_ASM_000338 /TAXON_ID=268821 /ORGANISM="Scrippsiella Hangoei, Strain SHTV-5" /LENGTH=45 /DNA_ID= /DNA_START= /DNA_END= /DNA_ORIENTATION=